MLGNLNLWILKKHLLSNKKKNSTKNMKCDLKKIEQCPLKLKNLNLGDPSFTISFSDMSRQPPAQMLFLDHFHLTYMCSLFCLTFTVMSWGIWGRTFSRNSLNSGAFSRFSSLPLGIFRKWMSGRIIGLTHWRRYSVRYRATSTQENNRTSVEWSINSSCSGNCAEVHE